MIRPDPPLKILLIEDDQSDAALTEKYFELAKIPHEITLASTGEQALKILRGGFVPDLILLDLKLPGKSGEEVLKEIKSDRKLRNIRIIILTESPYEDALMHNYNLGHKNYIHKPPDVNKILEFAIQKNDENDRRLQVIETEKAIKDGISKWTHTVCRTSTIAFFSFCLGAGKWIGDNSDRVMAAAKAFWAFRGTP